MLATTMLWDVFSLPITSSILLHPWIGVLSPVAALGYANHVICRSMSSGKLFPPHPATKASSIQFDLMGVSEPSDDAAMERVTAVEQK